jgi:hypothetical protein
VLFLRWPQGYSTVTVYFFALTRSFYSMLTIERTFCRCWDLHPAEVAQPHADFHAETALDAVVSFLRQYGLPPMLTFDRDPRWVGSASGRDFQIAPSPLLALPGHPAQYLPTQAARQKLLRKERYIEVTVRSAFRCIDLPPCKKCATSPSNSCTITMSRDRTRGVHARISRHRWLFLPCQNCLLCPKPSILMAGHHAEFCVMGKTSSWERFCMAEQGSEEGEKAEVLSTSEYPVHKIAKKERCPR